MRAGLGSLNPQSELPRISVDGGSLSITAKQAEGTLKQIFHSPSFIGSKQSQNLLAYLVRKSLNGDDESLKERVIGAEVFGRPLDYNTGDDPVVRARVGDLRKRLAQHYQNESVGEDTIRFVIPLGSYRVSFEEGAPTVGSVPQNAPHSLSSVDRLGDDSRPSPTKGESKIPLRARRWLLVAGVAVAVALLFSIAKQQRGQSTLDQFWAPFLRNPKQIMLYSGTNGIFSPTSKYRAKHPQANRLAVPLAAGEVLTSDDVIPSSYEFTTIGELIVDEKVASFLTSQHHDFYLRTGDNVAVGDLRSSPSILVGGFNNPWAMELASRLPFVFQWKDGNAYIVERGGNRAWHTDPWESGLRKEDYAIAARLLNPETGNPVIIVAGTTSAGTTSAGEFLTSNDLLRDLIARAPKDWKTKNLEVVLHTNILKGDPGRATVVAEHYW